MAEVNPPLYLQTGTYPAFLDRELARSLLSDDSLDAPRSGVIYDRTSSLKVAASTSNVVVSAGSAAIVDGGGGVYVCTNDISASVILPITATSGLPRIDIVGAHVRDSDAGDAGDDWELVVLEGTARTIPSDPSYPQNFLPLSRVRMPANTTTVSSTYLDDLRVFTAARGGLIYGSSLTRPATVDNPVGQLIYDSDTKAVLFWNGSTWRQAFSPSQLSETGWLNITVSGGAVLGTNWSIGTATNCRGRKINLPSGAKIVEVELALTYSGSTITAVNTSGGHPGNITNEIVITLPSTWFPTKAVWGKFIGASTTVSGGCSLFTNGNFVLTDMHPNATLASGDDVTVNLLYVQ